MRQLVLGIAMSIFFVYASSASSSQGYCEQGLYIPTHIIECVAFCEDHGNVFTISSSGAPEDLRKCECIDGSIKQILPDLQRLQCPKVQCGVGHE